jgi:hypothetical protein
MTGLGFRGAAAGVLFHRKRLPAVGFKRTDLISSGQKRPRRAGARGHFPGPGPGCGLGAGCSVDAALGHGACWAEARAKATASAL